VVCAVGATPRRRGGGVGGGEGGGGGLASSYVRGGRGVRVQLSIISESLGRLPYRLNWLLPANIGSNQHNSSG